MLVTVYEMKILNCRQTYAHHFFRFARNEMRVVWSSSMQTRFCTFCLHSVRHETTAKATRRSQSQTAHEEQPYQDVRCAAHEPPQHNPRCTHPYLRPRARTARNIKTFKRRPSQASSCTTRALSKIITYTYAGYSVLFYDGYQDFRNTHLVLCLVPAPSVYYESLGTHHYG